MGPLLVKRRGEEEGWRPPTVDPPKVHASEAACHRKPVFWIKRGSWETKVSIGIGELLLGVVDIFGVKTEFSRVFWEVKWVVSTNVRGGVDAIIRGKMV